MPNFFYYDANGQKFGPVNDQQLEALAAQGIIVPQTPMETDTGHQGQAGQIPGLFATPVQPVAQTHQVAPKVAKTLNTYFNVFLIDTVVGVPLYVLRMAVFIFSLIFAASDAADRDLAPYFAGIGGGTAGGTASSGGVGKSRIAAALLAILLGGWGIHKFYMGSWGWGLAFVGFVILTVGAGALITCIASLVDGIRYLMMTDDDFAAKYPVETQSPFC